MVTCLVLLDFATVLRWLLDLFYLNLPWYLVLWCGIYCRCLLGVPFFLFFFLLYVMVFHSLLRYSLYLVFTLPGTALLLQSPPRAEPATLFFIFPYVHVYVFMYNIYIHTHMLFVYECIYIENVCIYGCIYTHTHVRYCRR